MWHQRELAHATPQRMNRAAASSNFLASTSGTGRVVDVSPLTSNDIPTLRLEGHSAQVDQLHADGWQLLTAASDYVFLWNIEHCLVQASEGRMPSGIIVKQLPRQVTAMCITAAHGRVALASQSGVDIYKVKSGARQAELLCENLPLPADFVATFVSFRENGDCLLCISSDSVLLLSDFHSTGSILMQHVLAPPRACISAVCLADSQSELWFATNDSVLYLWRLPRLVRIGAQDSDLSRFEVRDVRNAKKCAQFGDLAASVLPDGCRPVPICMYQAVVDTRREDTMEKSLINSFELLFLAFDCFLAAFDCRKMVTVSYELFSDLLANEQSILDAALCTSGRLKVGAAKQSFVHCFAVAKSSRTGYHLACSVDDFETILNDSAKLNAPDQKLKLSVIADRSVRLPSSNAQKALSASSVKKPSTADKPLTFHSKVKSSGYGQTAAAPRALFKPQTNFSSAGRGDAARGNAKKPAKSCTLLNTKYPVDCVHTSKCVSSIEICEKNSITPINAVRCSARGKHLAAGLANRTIQVWKFAKKNIETVPNSKPASLLADAKMQAVLLGHDAALTDVNFSSASDLLVSCAADRTLRVWLIDKGDRPASKSGSGSGSGGLSSAGLSSTGDCVLLIDGPTMNAKKFDKDVRSAQFYYVDEFLLTAVGDRVYLFEYNVDLQKPDVQRYLTNTHFKMWKTFAFPTECSHITALSAANTFYSNLVVAASSSRGLAVFDLYHDGCVWQVAEAHSRPCHQVAQCGGSLFATVSPESYNMLATVAHQDSTKIWDLRCCSAVQQFDDYSGQRIPSKVRFSPCAKFLSIASSEALYVYDIRWGQHTYLTRISPTRSDALADLDVHPKRATTFCGSIDGKLHEFL